MPYALLHANYLQQGSLVRILLFMTEFLTSPYVLAILAVVLVSLVAVIGIFALSLRERSLRASVFALVSLSVGALLGDAFIHLIPEAFAEGSSPLSVSLAVIGGILLFFVIEKFFHWHHHQGLPEEPGAHPVGKMILLSDGVHNFIDGLIIGASFLVSTEVGIATTIAVILHEIPQEIGDFGVLLHAGYSRAKALWYNFLSALTAIVGAGISLSLGASSEAFAAWLIPLAAGGFIYIALSDLIPELHKEKALRHSVAQFLWIIAGVVSMVLLLGIEGDAHAHEEVHDPMHEEVHID